MNFPDWLEVEFGRLASMHEREQLPHALLIHGPVGVGRRLLAFRLAERLLKNNLGIPEPARLCGVRIDDEALPSHPDFKVIQPEEKDKKPGEYKKTISVDQIRELINFLQLTSHQSGGKAVIFFPAQSMTQEAANCLLKTLEEPAANTYLMLVAESLSGLPPTIVSRCHRVRVALPDRQTAAQWLQGIDPKIDWYEALELSSGAPLVALDWQRGKFLELAADLEKDLSALERGSETPAMVAKRWAKEDLEHCLRWLFNRLGGEIRSQIHDLGPNSIENSEIRRLQKSGETLNIEPSFAVLRQIGELRRLQGAGLNMELHLTHVLSRWYGSGQRSGQRRG